MYYTFNVKPESSVTDYQILNFSHFLYYCTVYPPPPPPPPPPPVQLYIVYNTVFGASRLIYLSCTVKITA